MSTPAYAWLLATMARVVLHWDSSEPRYICLDLFETRYLRKPITYQASFQLPWNSMRMVLHEDISKKKRCHWVILYRKS